MTPDPRRADDPGEWLRRAKSNLSRARSHAQLPDVYLEDLCFDAQQAAEKAIKAVLVDNGVDFPHVHDIALLLDLTANAGVEIDETLVGAEALTRFAVVTRYPSPGEAISLDEYEHAVAKATAVVDWASKRLDA